MLLYLTDRQKKKLFIVSSNLPQESELAYFFTYVFVTVEMNV